MTRHVRVLCLAAHPDDLEVYMGGALLLLAQGGARLRAVVATAGEAATRQPASGEPSRRAEQERTFAALGIEGRFLGLPDRGLAAIGDLSAHVAAEVRDFGPDLVFAPHPGDRHDDHVSLGRAAPAEAWRWIGIAPEVEPTHFVGFRSRAAWERKRDLVLHHGSQIPRKGESRDHLPGGLDILERAEQRDRAWGRQHGLAYAEPLVAPAGVKAPTLLWELGDFLGGEA